MVMMVFFDNLKFLGKFCFLALVTCHHQSFTPLGLMVTAPRAGHSNCQKNYHSCSEGQETGARKTFEGFGRSRQKKFFWEIG
jgi:hypothetical protein